MSLTVGAAAEALPSARRGLGQRFVSFRRGPARVAMVGGMAPSQRVLVVEDDPAIARLLEVELSEAGYAVELAGTGADGLAAVERDEPAIVLLDVRLPDIDGLSVCRQARRCGHGMPILMLTALDRVGDRVVGLD